MVYNKQIGSLQIDDSACKYGYEAVSLKDIFIEERTQSEIFMQVNIIFARLIDQEGFHEDTELLSKLSKNLPKNKSYLKRDLDCRAHSEAFRATFRLSADEKLDGTINCAMWTPFNKRHEKGTLYLSNNYVCFKSKVPLNWLNKYN